MAMFVGREQIGEILGTIKANKLRTFLTGFAVGWGILLLVVLLSSGTGFSNGLEKTVKDAGYESNTVQLQTGYVSEPSESRKKWSDVQLNREDLEYLLRLNVDVISLMTPVRDTWGVSCEANGLTERRRLVGVEAEYVNVQHFRFVAKGSRFISERDGIERRKVIVLSEAMAKLLFGSADKALGQVVLVSKIAFRTIGVVKNTEGSFSPSYIPLSTMTVLGIGLEAHERKGQLNGASFICPNIKTEAECDSLKAKMIRQLSPRLGTHPSDKSILRLNSVSANNAMLSKVILGIDIFLWVIGLSSLIIGLVGVVNIMQISIIERTCEIGIRKALGAKPRDIILMLLCESTLVTLVSGLTGLVVGVGLMVGIEHLVNAYGLGQMGVGDMELFNALESPVITLETAIGAICVMVIGGVLSGYFPARKAVRVPAVEAMRR